MGTVKVPTRGPHGASKGAGRGADALLAGEVVGHVEDVVVWLGQRAERALTRCSVPLLRRAARPAAGARPARARGLRHVRGELHGDRRGEPAVAQLDPRGA